MKKILIFGDGQIGNFYLNFFTAKGDQASVAKKTDIRNYDQVIRAIDYFHPTTIINTAAMTSLEWCSINQLEAFDNNVLGAATLAKAADEKNVYFIHFSSGCIFSSVDGSDSKKEDDEPNPASYYGWTKVWSEEMVTFNRSDNFKPLILRPRQPVSAQVNHRNMLVKMLTFSKFVDTANSGTVLEDLMDWTNQLIDRQATGIYHVANIGYTTPYRISLMIKKYILPELEPEKITKTELDKMTPNTRVDAVLDSSKLQNLGIKVAAYENRLQEVMQKLAKNIDSMDKLKLKEILEDTAAASKQRTVINNVYSGLYE